MYNSEEMRFCFFLGTDSSRLYSRIPAIILLHNYRAERRLSRRKSRSSSESSGRHTDLPKYKSDDFNRSSRSHSRKFDPSSRSQSGQSSRCSSVSRDQSNVNVTSRDVIKLLSPKLNISKNPSIDFANLETRISALQKALFSDKYAEN